VIVTRNLEPRNAGAPWFTPHHGKSSAYKTSANGANFQLSLMAMNVALPLAHSRFTVKINVYYDLRIPIQRFTSEGNTALRIIGKVVEPLSKVYSASRR
jgi:hypothetical protein